MSIDAVVCGKCGGLLLPSGIFSKIAMSTQRWFYELDSESRLNETLAMYMAVDWQVRQGAPITAAVQLATKQISLEFAGMEEKVQRTIIEKLDNLNGLNQEAVKHIGDSLNQGLQGMVGQIMTLVEQGKSASEIEASVKEAAGALQSYVLALKLPGVQGEEGEKSVLRELEDAFLGQTCIKVESLGGADATDAIVKFQFGGVEIGRSLVEVKSRKNWSNDFLDQTRTDMKRYNAAFAILVVKKLPRTAKTKGYHVDAGEGLVITTTPELVTPTLTMFYEIHAASYKLQKKALDLETLSAEEDLVYYVNDNMKVLDDCKKISDIVEDSSRKIKERTTSIGSRLKDNNRRIAEILSKYSHEKVEGA
jgi:hypothetical protein